MPALTRRLHAITREVGIELAGCELSFVARSPIDPGRAAAQHEAYVECLRALGCEVQVLPPLPDHPDAVFVEDTAIVLPELAVLTRPGAPSRRAEVATIAATLEPYRRCVSLQAPATVDGGDVLRIGQRIYVGQSARSNAEGVGQLRAAVSAFGYSVTAVATRDCLHLKSAVTQVGDNRILINPEWVDREAFRGYELIEVDPDEPHAANVLRVGDALVYPDNFPKTRARLEAAGAVVHALDVSELQKAEGAVTCCSLVFEA